ncbi:DUF6520 family protein [Flavobacterium sp. 5]|uniref:DUF6520 family protein n=1 Tax=Flavobacterium sp. 5 TaxID=2035199 RepID=UPI000C2C8516|nr:DUF6520 family protein [Flavobacterium sp. 5]PKB18055.1 hypothetical protein CLU82_3310 [Flavobacterium sp. 5]
MKTNLLKMFVLPLAAFALASAGAVSTNVSSKSKTALPIVAYIHNPSVNDCDEVEVECSPGTGAACLSSGFTAYAKNAQGKCVAQLHYNN